MQALGAQTMLELFDRCAGAGRTRQTVALLTAAEPGSAAADWLGAPLGEVHRASLELRRLTFGDTVRGVLPCAACGEWSTCEVSVADLLDGHTQPPAAVPVVLSSGVRSARTLTLADVEAATALAVTDAAAARAELARRALEPPASDTGGAEAVEELSADDLDRVERALAEADPFADLSLAIECTACGAKNTVGLDVLRYLWKECASTARQLLVDVHALAAHYHWSERDILALSPARRRFYLECLG